MKKNYMTPYAQLNVITSKDVITLSVLGNKNVDDFGDNLDITIGGWNSTEVTE